MSKHPFIFMLDQFGEGFFTWFLSEFFTVEDVVNKWSLMNHQFRKIILSSEMIWENKINQYFSPRVNNRFHELMNLQVWTIERSDRLDRVLSQTIEYVEWQKISIGNEALTQLSAIYFDFAFQEINFNNGSIRVKCAKLLACFRNAYIMTCSSKFLSPQPSLKSLLGSIPNKQVYLWTRKIYSELFYDLFFTSIMPCTAFLRYYQGYSMVFDEEKISDPTGKRIFLPFIDYGVERIYHNNFFQVHPFVCFGLNSMVRQLDCIVRVSIGNKLEERELTYPRDINIILEMMESYFTNVDFDIRSEFPYKGSPEIHLGLTQTQNDFSTPLNKVYIRRNCLDPACCLRYYYQNAVQVSVKQLLKGLTRTPKTLCRYLAGFPTNKEIAQLFETSGRPFQNMDDFNPEASVFLQGMWSLYKDKTFNPDKTLERSIDKCLRRYLNMLIISQPTLQKKCRKIITSKY